MSDTPRTDAVREAGRGHPLRMIRMTEHAKKLERELNAWQSMACELAEVVRKTSDRDGELLYRFEQLKGETK